MNDEQQDLQGFALSPQQERIWQQQEITGTVFRARAVIGVEGEVDAGVLEEALNDLVEYHEILRTVFLRVAGLELPVQAVMEANSVEFLRLSEGADEPETAPPDLEKGSAARFILRDLPEGSELLVELPSLYADGTTLAILTDLISDAYRLRVQGESIATITEAADEEESEELQYADIAAWQCDLLENEDGSRSSWYPSPPLPLAKMLLGAERPTRLHDGGLSRIESRWDTDIAHLQATAEENNTKLNTLFLACWAQLLTQHTNRDEIVVGVVFENRDYEGLEGVLGPLSKALPLTCRAMKGVPFTRLLTDIEDRLAQAAEELDSFFWDASVTVGGASSFPFLFSARSLPVPKEAGAVRFRLEDQAVEMEHCRAGLDLLFSSTGVRARLAYDSAVLSAESARYLLDGWLHLVQQVVAKPEASLTELDHLGPEERNAILKVSGSLAPLEVQASFPELFSRQAAHAPRSVAARFNDRTLSYGELESKSNKLARHLLALGVQKGEYLGLLIDRSFEMLIAILGALKAGAAYLPLDPESPTERHARIFEEANVRFLLTRQQAGFKDLTASVEKSPQLLRLDADWSKIAEQADGPLESLPILGQAAYVIYTSGSTGRPKGVVVSHHGLANYLRWSIELYGLGAGSVSIVHSPLSFDLTVTSLLLPLASGGAVVLLPEGRGISPLSQLLRDTEVKEGEGFLVKMTPAHLDLLMSLHRPEEVVGKIQTMVLGGEALRWESTKRWRNLDPGTRLINEYGPTEAVVGCSTYEVVGEGRGGIPIGRPVPGMQLYVLGPDLRLLPFGSEGEIYIAGESVALGYLEQSRQSAERFVPDPFSNRPGRRFYRTGDLGRWRSDGELDYIGRIDTQVKLHGYRIELGEIEQVLSETPGVQEAVVVLRNDPATGSPLLVAYMIGEAEVIHSEVREALGARLPAYMVPAVYMTLDTWPLTPNGKVDRKALPEWQRDTGGRQDHYVAPRNLAEEILTNVWAEVLGQEQVGAEDDFFRLGGDSILTITALTKLRDWGFELSPQDFFNYPKLSDLARHAINSEPGAVTLLEPIGPFALLPEEDREQLPENIEAAYPLAYLQAGMLFHSTFTPETSIYLDMCIFRLQAKLDLRALRTVLERVLESHETLRTSFAFGEFSVPLQLVHKHLTLPLRVEDLRHFLPDEQEVELAAWREREKRNLFDPLKAPLIRFQVLVLGSESFQLVLSYHHSIIDGWSVASLLSEIFRHYVALIRGEIYHPPEISQYAFRDFIALEKETVGTLAQREFWLQELQGCRPLHLPVTVTEEHHEDPTAEIRSQDIQIDEELAHKLIERADAEKVPVKSLLLAVHCEVLSHLADQSEVTTGVVTHGRPEVPGGESMIGLFLNTLPMRIRLREKPGATWSELVREVFDWERRTISYRRLPIAEIQRLMGVQDLLQTVFNFFHFHVYQGLSPAEDVKVVSAEFFEETNFTFAANFMFDAAEGAFLGRLDFDASVLDPGLIERAAGYYRTFLEALVETPEEVRSDHSPLSAKERHQLLVEWSGVATEVPEDTLLERFRGWALSNGDEPALVWNEGSLSYRELDRRVGHLAHILREHGVSTGAVVGVSCHGSPEAVVAFLAIFEAGGIYLPLDPSYPEDHRQFMIREAKAALVLCTAETRSLLWAAGTDRLEVNLAELQESVAGESSRPRGAAQHDIAYLIFTSGSTGRPKGVVLHHRGLANLGEQQRSLFDLGPGRRVLLFASLNFDASVWEMAMAFWSGAALCVGTRKELLPGIGLIDTLRDRGVTHVTLPPTALATLPADDLPELVYLVSAGEALPPALVRRWATSGRHVFNAYGPTESTVCATLTEVTPYMSRPPIGRALTNIRIWVLDKRLRAAPVGVPGHLYLGGVGLASSYLRRPSLTAERFVPDPFSGEPGSRIYATGDQVSFHVDGQLDYIGRIDRQVKVRGFRIEPGEIELRLAEHPGLRQVAVVTRGTQASSQLIAFAVPHDNSPKVEEVRRFLGERLPTYMVPGRILYLDSMPLTPSGKINYKVLEKLEATEVQHPELATAFVTPRSEVERSVAEIVREVLEIDRVGLDDNLFDLGGHSLHLLRIQSKLRQLFGKDIPLMEFFERSTVRELASLATPAGESTELRARSDAGPRTGGRYIAIIGMAGRFPGANSVDELWHTLAAGKETITFFSDAELFAAGVEPEVFEDPNYVPARAVLDGVEYFDASFFGLTPREAELMDPQHRLFLEHAWTALESAGYNPTGCRVPVGVFGGTSANSYMFHLMANPEVVESLGLFQAVLSNDKDFLSTQTSYKLDLEGPSMTVQTACSTSLVAVHLACRSLLAGECDMALAGGVSVRLPQVSGHLYVEGGIDSPDGHCRPFDAKAAGTVAGNGVGIVVLKPLEMAQADGDRVLAVIKGSAINNDGSHKVGFTAPRIEGQARVIREAHVVAGVDAGSISYVEAHGTGTHLGDPIEVSALTRAFRASTDERGFCALGSVKSNFGHLDAAAGVTGLIKTVLSLHHKAIPQSLHYESPNPRLELASSPFYVPNHLTPWTTTPRRAGVSSFGIGGTNVHVVLEEAPERPHTPAPPREHSHLLPLSAHTQVSLERMRQRLAEHLEAHPELEISDVAHTLQVGRRSFPHRLLWQVADRDAAVAELSREESGRRSTEETRDRAIAFLLPGQGSQHPNMTRELYEHFTRFRNDIDHGAELLEESLGFNIRDALFPAQVDQEAHDRLAHTAVAQPAIFLVEHALARLWMSLGVRPQALLGHSIGELTAATLAGVFRFEDALKLVCARGRLIGELPTGAMLSVACSLEDLGEMPESVEVAALNGPNTVVLSGPRTAISELAERLEATGDGPQIRRLVTSHAFHSAMMEPAMKAFEEAVGAVRRKRPNIPFLSNVTGDWITPAEAVSPAYWARHLRSAVRFGDGLSRLFAEPERVLLEVGPGQTLSALARRHPEHRLEVPVIPSLPHADQSQRADEHLIGAVGELWLSGQPIDWENIGNTEGRLLYRVALPTYAFDRHRYWVDSDPSAFGKLSAGRRQAVNDWLYAPTWQRDAPPAGEDANLEGLCLLFSDGGPLGNATAEALRAQGVAVAIVEAGEGRFEHAGELDFVMAPGEKEGYDELFAALDSLNTPLTTIVHIWNVNESSGVGDREQGLYSLVQLGRQLATRPPAPRRLLVVASGLYDVLGGEPVMPERRQMEGPCLVLPQEVPHLHCRLIDPGTAVQENPARFAERLCEEFFHKSRELAVAWRGAGRWHQIFKQLKPRPTPDLEPNGVYLLFGGLGQIGLTIAENLVREGGARLLLTRRSALPDQELEAVRELRELGGEVHTMAFDLADENALREAVEKAEVRWGRIDGVFHFAGAVGDGTFRAFDELDRAEVDRQLRAKVEGTLALSRVLDGREVGFCILFSSLSSTLGGLGFGAYAAANAFQGAFAEEQRRRGLPWTSIDWDGWQFPSSSNHAAQARGIRPHEGIRALNRALAQGHHPRLLVSTSDVEERKNRWVNREHDEDDGTAGTPKSLQSRPGLKSPYVAPGTEAERRLVALFTELLGVDNIGIQDNFFELGGHSLLATQLTSRLHEVLGRSVPLRAVFDNPTIAELARPVGEEAVGEPPAVQPASRDQPIPLSCAQRRLWFLDQLVGGGEAYNIFSGLRLEGPLDRPALVRSLNEIIRRHEILRTVVCLENDEPVQQIQSFRALVIPEVDLCALPAEFRDDAARRVARQCNAVRFDLTRGPLLSFSTFRLADREHVFWLTVHHIVCDGWSVGVFIRELSALYGAFAAGKASPLPELPTQYADYAVWQRDWLKEQLEPQVAYWKKRLRDLPTVSLPLDHPRPAQAGSRGASAGIDLELELADRLRALAQDNEVTLFMVLLAAFNSLLHLLTGQEDLVVGTNVAGRRRPELETLVGCFINNLVLRTELKAEQPFTELLQHTREITLDAYDHQDVPFEHLVEALRPERDPSRHPLFQILFTLQIAVTDELELPGIELGPFDLEKTASAFDLLINCQEHRYGIRCAAEYNRDLFEPATVDLILENFHQLLHQIVEDPEQPIGSISWQGDEEGAEDLGGFGTSLADL